MTGPGVSHDRAGGGRAGLLACLVFLTLLAFYSCFHQNRDWNTASRLMLTYSLVQDGTIEISKMVAVNGRLIEHPHTRDLSSPGDGRYFCDKAPGQSLVGVPAYWLALASGLTRPHPEAAPASERLWPHDYWTTLGSSGLVTALSAAVLVLLLKQLGAGSIGAVAIGLAYGLATPALPYATLFYGHAAAGFFTLLSLYLVWRQPASVVGCLVAGACAGLAVTIDYPQAVFVFAIFLGILLDVLSRHQSRFRWRSCVWFIVGGIPLAVLLGYYHFLVTGSPFRVPYTLEVLDDFRRIHGQGYGIPIGLPNPTVVFELLAGTARGLVWHAPIVVAALPGLAGLVRRGELLLSVAIIGTFGGLLGINAGFENWDGGLATGPRFLVPALPLLLLAAGYWLGLPAKSAWGVPLKVGCWLLAIATGPILIACTVVGARTPTIPFPFQNHVLPMLAANRTSWHVGQSLAATVGSDGPFIAYSVTVGVACCFVGLVMWLARVLDQRQPLE